MLLRALTAHADLVSRYEAKYLEAYGSAPDNSEISKWPNSDILELCDALDIVIRTNIIHLKNVTASCYILLHSTD